MENCLFKKFVGVTDNGNLPFYGKAVIVVGIGDPSLKFNKDGIIKVLGGTVNGQTQLNVTANTVLTITSPTIVSDGTYGSGNIGLLVDKYNLTNVERFINFDAKDFEYTPLSAIQAMSAGVIQNPESFVTHFSKSEFTEFKIQSNTNIAMDLTELGSNGTMIDIRLLGTTKVYGSINKCGMSPLTTQFSTPNTKNVSLNIETFVGYHRAAGRTTGSLSLPYLGACDCTFNGAAVSLQADNTLSWTATTITLNGTTIDA